MKSSTLYALDFDGVICDSAVETAMTGWKAAATIWPDMQGSVPQQLLQQFREVRPMIETGYEAILAMRLLHLTYSTEAIVSDYPNLISMLMTDARVTVDDLKRLFGRTRDAWIANDLADWVAMNPLFENVAAKLRALAAQADWVIITTKQERFVKQILQANQIELADQFIYGLDRNMSKVEVLTELLAANPRQQIIFVEDRLPTLINVARQAALKNVKLVLAIWGYNTVADQDQARQQGFLCQALSEFLSIN